MKYVISTRQIPRSLEIQTSQIVAIGKIVLVEASLTALAAVCTAIFYDGVDASGSVKKRLSTVANTTAAINMSHGIIFEHGLYIAVTGANVSVDISYLTIDDRPCDDITQVDK